MSRNSDETQVKRLRLNQLTHKNKHTMKELVSNINMHIQLHCLDTDRPPHSDSHSVTTLIYVVSGKGVMEVYHKLKEDVRFHVASGDALIIPSYTFYTLRNMDHRKKLRFWSLSPRP